jgi:hypothetical protein
VATQSEHEKEETHGDNSNRQKVIDSGEGVQHHFEGRLIVLRVGDD